MATGMAAGASQPSEFHSLPNTHHPTNPLPAFLPPGYQPATQYVPGPMKGQRQKQQQQQEQDPSARARVDSFDPNGWSDVRQYLDRMFLALPPLTPDCFLSRY